jgi:hypothetical protein
VNIISREVSRGLNEIDNDTLDSINFPELDLGDINGSFSRRNKADPQNWKQVKPTLYNKWGVVKAKDNLSRYAVP